MKNALAISLAVVTACATATPPSSTPDPDVAKAASDALAIFIESWNSAAAGDAQAPARYGDLYWPDADLVDPSGSIWNGRSAIQQMHVDLWHTAFKGSQISGRVRSTRRLSSSVMITDFDLNLALFKEATAGSKEANGVVNAHLKMVMQNRGGAWKVVAAQNTFYTDPAPRK